MISLFDTTAATAPLRSELRDAIARVLDSGIFVLGPEVQAFEREFAGHLGVEHAIGVANGTDALTIALRAMGVGPGDDVVVPSFTLCSVTVIRWTLVTPVRLTVICDVPLPLKLLTIPVPEVTDALSTVTEVAKSIII